MTRRGPTTQVLMFAAALLFVAGMLLGIMFSASDDREPQVYLCPNHDDLLEFGLLTVPINQLHSETAKWLDECGAKIRATVPATVIGPVP